MIALACVLAHLVASLFGARHLYARLRARAIDKAATKKGPFGSRHPSDAVAHFNEWDKGDVVLGAVLAAVFWPIAIAGFGVYRFVTANPTLSRTELAAERDAMAQRIRDLERELGIKETP